MSFYNCFSILRWLCSFSPLRLLFPSSQPLCAPPARHPNFILASVLLSLPPPCDTSTSSCFLSSLSPSSHYSNPFFPPFPTFSLIPPSSAPLISASLSFCCCSFLPQGNLDTALKIAKAATDRFPQDKSLLQTLGTVRPTDYTFFFVPHFLYYCAFRGS